MNGSCVYECNAKADAAAWAAVGCVVSGNMTGTKRSDLGDGKCDDIVLWSHISSSPRSVRSPATPALGWDSCSITCPVDGQDFVVRSKGAALPPPPQVQLSADEHHVVLRFKVLQQLTSSHCLNPVRRDCTVNGLVCEPNSCDTYSIIGAVRNADYTDCGGKTSGQTCTPQCLTGYKSSTEPSTIALNCDASGTFYGFNDLVCDTACLPGYFSETGGGVCSPFSTETQTKDNIKTSNVVAIHVVQIHAKANVAKPKSIDCEHRHTNWDNHSQSQVPFRIFYE